MKTTRFYRVLVEQLCVTELRGTTQSVDLSFGNRPIATGKPYPFHIRGTPFSHVKRANPDILSTSTRIGREVVTVALTF